MNIIKRFKVPVKCEHCEHTFNNSRAQEQHMESEHDFSLSQVHSTWHCVRCDNEFKTEKESLDHFAKEHNVIIKEEPKTVK